MDPTHCPIHWHGHPAYALGRGLIDDGVRLDTLMWDADELLWDWVMSMRSIFSTPYRRFRLGDVGHLEFMRLKQGILELLWGMHSASVDRGLDPYLRIWTNGYAWRLWRISQHVPCLARLIGPAEPHLSAPTTADAWQHHPRVFARQDYVEAMFIIAREGVERVAPVGRREVARQLETRRFDSSLKEPALAEVVGKTAFSRVRVLIDDKRENLERFVKPGRTGIHIPNATPHVLRGRIANTVWGDPAEALDAMCSDPTEALARALRELAAGTHDGEVVTLTPAPAAPPHHDFAIEAPDARVRLDWVEPMRRLERHLGAPR